MKLQILAFLFLTFACYGCHKSSKAPRLTSTRSVQTGKDLAPIAIPGSDTMELDMDLDDLLRVADTVQVARIHRTERAEESPTPTTSFEYFVSCGDCDVDAVSPEYDPEEARKLAEILLDPSNHVERRNGKMLLVSEQFKPQLAFRICAGDDSAMIFWDPELGVIAILEDEVRGICVNLGDYGHDVSPARGRLTALVKELLGSDPVIMNMR